MITELIKEIMKKEYIVKGLRERIGEMKIELQRKMTGFCLICISYNINTWGSAYKRCLAIWLLNAGFTIWW
jgi:hypothetical protein